MPGVVRETTEWEDIQRRFGNLPPAELIVDDEALGVLADEAADRHEESKYDDMDVDDIDALLDEAEDAADDEDMRFLAEYRSQRLAALYREVERGVVRTLESRDQFAERVTRAPPGETVVVHLFRERLTPSDMMDAAIVLLARKFNEITFFRMASTTCIPGYPDANLPTLLVYRDGVVRKTLAGLTRFGGPRMTPDDVEWELAQEGVLRTELEENPHISTHNRVFVNIQRS
mgnify:CR=1 FL=1